MGRSASSHARRARRAATLTAFLDTNVLIRHLTGDPPELAARAAAALAGVGRLLLTDLVLAECVYVLESYYKVERARVAELMRSAIALPTIEALDPTTLLRALEVYELERVDFAETYPVAQAEATVNGHRFLPSGGHRFSPRAAMFSPHWWPWVLPMTWGWRPSSRSRARRARRSGDGRARLAAQGHHPLAGGRLGEPVALGAVGDEHVCVME